MEKNYKEPQPTWELREQILTLAPNALNEPDSPAVQQRIAELSARIPRREGCFRVVVPNACFHVLQADGGLMKFNIFDATDLVLSQDSQTGLAFYDKGSGREYLLPADSPDFILTLRS